MVRKNPGQKLGLKSNIKNCPRTPNSYTTDSLTATGFVTIAALEKLASEQLISVKAQVAKISGTKKLQTQYQGILTSQEVIIRDPTTSIKLILWQDNVNTLTIDKTYAV